MEGETNYVIPGQSLYSGHYLLCSAFFSTWIKAFVQVVALVSNSTIIFSMISSSPSCSADVLMSASGDQQEFLRLLFDMTFFFFVIVILLAIIQGLSCVEVSVSA